MSTAVAEGTKDKAAVETPIATRPKMAGTMAVYNRMEPMDFINKMGPVFFNSKMFGCNNIDQGRALALGFIVKGIDPFDFVRRNHIIGGKVCMKTETMLADFNTVIGGSHRLIARTPDRAAVELQRGKNKNIFEFTWAEAQLEDYVYTSQANDGKVPKKLANGEINPKALKDNWSTPRRRMQMLWHRCLSDGIRTVAAEVSAGMPTPEELGAAIDEDGTVMDAEYSVVANAPAPTATVATAAPAPTPTPTAVAPEPPVEEAVVSEAEAPTDDQTVAEPAKPEGAEPAPQFQPAPQPASDKLTMLREIKAILDRSAPIKEHYKAMLAEYDVVSAKELDDDQVFSLLHRVQAADKAIAHANGTDEVSQWANKQLGN